MVFNRVFKRLWVELFKAGQEYTEEAVTKIKIKIVIVQKTKRRV